MSLPVVAAALLAATSLVQSHGPLTGASPDILDITGGWEMTPKGSRCTLTHAGSGGRQDLVIQGAAGTNTLAVGVLAPTGSSYAAPVQLTMMAQADSAQLVGRVTFKPANGDGGTLLLASWPADRLFPRLRSADRLNVFGPDERLIRSIRLSNVDEAIDRLGRCLQSEGATPAAPASDQPPSRPRNGLSDVGWLVERDGGNCRMKRARSPATRSRSR